MTAKRDLPFSRFNFLVDLGTGETNGPDAGFEECGPIAAEVTVVEYRNGNDATDDPHKLSGLARYSDVTLKRGVIGSATLYSWFDQVRNGDETALRTVRISLLSEDHATVVQTWVLQSARLVKYVSGPFNAKSSEVAIEEITLAYERLVVQDAA